VTWRAAASGPGGALPAAGRKTIGVGALPVRESLTRWVEVPFRNAGKAERVLAAALDIQLPFALEDCAYTFLEIRRAVGRDATRALAVAAREADVARRVDEMKARGVDPVVLDHEGLALWSQALRELPARAADGNRPRIVVYAGTDRSAIVVGLGEEYLGAYGLRSLDSVNLLRVLPAAYEGERARM
jgi:Tfp pilus assembly PilM family ATPase